MILVAKNQKDFIFKLVNECKFYLKPFNFQESIYHLKRLSLIEINYFYKNDDTTHQSFKGRKFNIDKPLSIGTHKIEQISSLNDINVIISHGIEGILRKIFKNNKVRDLINLILMGDETLKSALLKATYYGTVNFSKEKEEDINLFPVKSVKDGIEIYSELPNSYLDNSLFLILLVSLIQNNYKIPLGNYEIRSSLDIYENLPDENLEEVISYPYKIFARIDTFSCFKDETLLEKIYNASNNVSYFISKETLNEIESFIINESHFKFLYKLLFLVSSLLGIDNKNSNIIINLFNKILNNIDELDINQLILKREFTNGKSISNILFYEILPKLTLETLFEIYKENKKIIKVIDANGIEIGNLPNYIYKELLKRLINEPKMSLPLKSILSDLDSLNSKLNLIFIIFKDKIKENI